MLDGRPKSACIIGNNVVIRYELGTNRCMDGLNCIHERPASVKLDHDLGARRVGRVVE